MALNVKLEQIKASVKALPESKNKIDVARRLFTDIKKLSEEKDLVNKTAIVNELANKVVNELRNEYGKIEVREDAAKLVGEINQYLSSNAVGYSACIS